MFSTINSGLSTSSQALSVNANNLANSNTVGFKNSTVSFADVFANDPAANQKTAIGMGAHTISVDRVMSQGAITSTGRVTDLAITGQGFFVLQNPLSDYIPPSTIPVFNGNNLQAGNWEPPELPEVNPLPIFNGDPLPGGSYTQPDLPDLQVRIKYNVEFENGDFDDINGTTNGTLTSIPGWDIYREQVRLGQGVTPGSTIIAGYPTAIDPTNPINSPGDDAIQSRISYSSEFVDGGVRLLSDGTSVNRYDVVHGPYIVSKDPVYIAPDANVSFKWKAANGTDNFDVFGYLLNTATGDTIPLLDATGRFQDWTTSTTKIGADQGGEYKFVFVSGTFDATGGTVTGASLYIDDVTITGNTPPQNTSDDYYIAVDQNITHTGGPVIDRLHDLSNEIDSDGNLISVGLRNPDGPWSWSYEILKDGTLVQSGTWAKSEVGIRIADYALPSIEPPSITASSPSQAWTFNNINGQCSNVFFCDQGQGSNAHDGFSGKDQYISFGNGGSAGERYLSFSSLDLTQRASVSFDLIRGNNGNGGQSPDAGEDLLVEYSLDGITYINLATLAHDDSSFNQWTRKTVTFPVEAQTASTHIRFRQPASSGPEFDHWGLSNIDFDPIPIPPPPEPASSSSTLGAEYSWSTPHINGKAKGVYLNSQGTGEGEHDGFSGRYAYINFGLGGDAGERYITLDDLDTRQKEFIKFDVIKGNNSNGGQLPDLNEGLKLLYTTDGVNFNELMTFESNSIVYDEWTSIRIPLPQNARSENTSFKFIQAQSSGAGYDHWGLYNIELTELPRVEEDTSVAFTRAGNFLIDKDGYVTNNTGMRLLGKNLNTQEDLVPIRIPLSEDRFVEGISIDPKGLLSISFSDGSIEKPFQLTLANFASDTGLRPIGNTMFRESNYSGKAIYGLAGSKGLGTLMSGALEQSNTDITSELMLMMKHQQAFASNSRMLQTYVEMASRLTDRI